jgi:hypothetical protein
MMKRNVSLTILVSVIIFTTVSCKKNQSTDKHNGLTVEDAKIYLQRLETKYGNYDSIKIPGKTGKNFKKVDFSKAYIGENERSYFIEAPISYTNREIVFFGSSNIPSATLNKMVDNSFDRFVIYKDKMSGMVSEKIVTYIPSADYVSNGPNYLYNNHYQSIVEDFSGYVSSKDWKGKFLSSQQYNSGKAVAQQTNNARVMGGACELQTLYHSFQICEDFDPVTGDKVNCYDVSFPYNAFVCTSDPQNPGDPNFPGWPDPQNRTEPTSCPTGPRLTESPITYAGFTSDGLAVEAQFTGGCECPGYSFLILEDVTTGTEYTYPLDIHEYPLPDCYTFWKTTIPIPASVPNGSYYVKAWFDGDLFYNQLENVNTGEIIRRIKIALLR